MSFEERVIKPDIEVDKSAWVLDEEGIICSRCGKDIFNCKCPRREDKDAQDTL